MMAVTSGFFNSSNNDRVYSAEEFGRLFEGVITNGIFRGVGGELAPSIYNGTSGVVKVASGRAWLSNCWIDNNSDLTIHLPSSDPVLNRRDCIVLEVDKRSNVRQGSIKVLTGSPSSSTSPAEPALTNNAEVSQRRLASFYRPKGTSNIRSDGMRDYRSAQHSDNIGFVTSVADIHDHVIPKDLASHGRVNSSDLVLMGRPAGGQATKYTLSDLFTDAASVVHVANRNNFYREVNLGTSVTSSQLSAIRNGTFEGLYLGSYWTINGNKYRIVHFDYYYGFGGVNMGSGGTTKCTSHHVIVMPDNNISSDPFALHSSNTTNGGLLSMSYRRSGSIYHSYVTSITSTLSGKLVRMPYVWTSGASQGWPTSRWHQDEFVLLPSEVQIFGSNIMGIRGQQTSSALNLHTYITTQFAGFRLNPQLILEPNGKSYWLSDHCSQGSNVSVWYDGLAVEAAVSYRNSSARPYLAIG